MREHGENTIRVEGAVVHNYPSSSFNESGIDRNMGTVEAAADRLERWVYYVHPDPDIGLTPEALDALKSRYEGFADLGCVAIAIHCPSGLIRRMAEMVTANLRIPHLLSDSMEELDAFVRDLLR